MFSELDHLIELSEEPVHSMAFFTQWLQWRVIALSGTRVVLHGSAGDELLCGYQHLCDIANFESLAKLNLRKYFSNHPFTDLRKHWHTLQWIFKVKAQPRIPNHLRTLLGLSDHSTIYFSKRFLESTDDVDQEFIRLYLEADSSLENRIRAEFELLRIPFWCNAMDKSMMSIPLEVRMPFLDYRLVEFTSQLPIEYLYSAGWSKRVLREAVKELLPDTVVWRKKKIGFSVPEREWLNQLKPEVIPLLKKEAEKLSTFINIPAILDGYDRMPEPLLWRIVNFAKWLDIFGPGINV
jgi:asparagine synthase (glutamine-hydrolysing)